MDVMTIYAVRNEPRNELDNSILDLISNLKISTRPPNKKPHNRRRQNREEPENWRDNVLMDIVRKVREKDDVDYEFVHNAINRITKELYNDITTKISEKIEARDDAFRLRVTTLLFDTSVRQPLSFFAPLLADLYQDIAREHPDALDDLKTQIAIFDTLYETSEGIVIPPSSDPGFDEAVRKWTKQKDLKRGFAIYISELYNRELIKEDTMMAMVNAVCADFKETIRLPKTPTTEQHAEALALFICATAKKVPMKEYLETLLKIPRPEVPSLNMKSRFKLEDAMKVSR